MTAFLDNVLNKYHTFMELGSLGPDLPYFTKWISLHNPKHPEGVDQWSYQLHSRQPNLYPLRLFEIIWKESDFEKADWADEDHCKWAFACGFLTHVAADQTIHPLVNQIAGHYYELPAAREKHKQCEIRQDLYELFKSDGKLTSQALKQMRFDKWCAVRPDLPPEKRPSGPLWLSILRAVLKSEMFRCDDTFIYLIQKAFVDAHAIAPDATLVKRWVKFALIALSNYNHVSDYLDAHRDLFDADGNLNPQSNGFQEYIQLQKLQELPTFKGRTYDDFFTDAAELARLYVTAAYTIYNAKTIDDPVREAFLDVVRSADLAASLERNILQTAKSALPELQRRVATQ